ncbi:MAG: prolyl oligopeptidase family serine peptidase [Gemmatimonadetes bacterium]|nr:prolyl oligopeptidase family serine peptidase [Gemmatimonadota bacterium]NNK62588.1 S9 family peptidase [Gemmatimonadota bacterium]
MLRTFDEGREPARAGRAWISTVVAAAVAVCIHAVPALAQDGRPFTIDDALSVRTHALEGLSPNGRWAAVTVRTHEDRLNVDHFRFGDPTYVAPSREELLLLDTGSGELTPLIEGRVQVGGVSWSPDGDRLAWLRWDDEAQHLEVWSASDGRVRRVALDDGRSIASNSDLEWAPDGGWLVQLRAPGWAETSRAAYVEMSEGPIVVHDGSEPFLDWERVRNLGDLSIPVHVTPDGEVRDLLPEGEWGGFTFSDDGAVLTAVGTRPLETVYEGNDGTEWRMLRVDFATLDTLQLVEPSTDRPRPTWAPDGRRWAWADDGDVFVRSVDGDAADNLTEDHREPVSATDTTRIRYAVQRWSPDGRRLLLSSQRGWHLVDATGGTPELIYALDDEARENGPRMNVAGWSPDGDEIYVATSERDRWHRGLAVLDPEAGTLQTLRADENLYSSWTLSDDGSTWVFRMSDGDRPDELYAAGPGLSEVRRLTDLNPWLNEVALTRSELVAYLDVDGEKQYGILYYPIDYREGERYPLVAEVYEEFFDNGFNHRMNLVASQGWFGFRPSVDLEEGFPGEAWMKGVTTGINTLIDRGMVDGERLGIHGTSYGGYAVNLLVTQTDRFAAAINISGKVNIISFLGDSEKITTRNYRAAESGQDRIGATLWEQPQKYLAHTAVLYADRIETPLLLLSGEGDWNVPATNQREMYYALRRLEKEVVWVNYMRAGHGAGRAGTVEDFHDHWTRILAWYRDHFDEAAARVTEEAGG